MIANLRVWLTSPLAAWAARAAAVGGGVCAALLLPWAGA